MATMKLTKAHRDAGIIEIRTENFNGSHTCLVDIRKVDLINNEANPRRHSQQHSDKIGSKYNKRCVRNPILRYRNGKLVTCDGRHTTWMLRNRNEFFVTCEVHFNITNAEAAAIFFNLTANNKRITPWDAHVTGLIAEYPWAIEIQDKLDNYRLTTPNSMGVNGVTADVRAYTPLQEAYETNNGCLEKLCFLLDQTYRDTTRKVDRHAKDVGFLRGLVDLIESEEYNSFSATALASRLGRRSAGWIYERAVDHMANSNGCRPDRSHYLEAFRDAMEIPSKRVA